MFRIFKRKEDKFQKLIEQQAELAFEGMKLLVKYLETANPDIAGELSFKEKEADEVRRILIDELNSTFVTPFDRDDDPFLKPASLCSLRLSSGCLDVDRLSQAGLRIFWRSCGFRGNR